MCLEIGATNRLLPVRDTNADQLRRSEPITTCGMVEQHCWAAPCATCTPKDRLKPLEVTK